MTEDRARDVTLEPSKKPYVKPRLIEYGRCGFPDIAAVL